MPPAPESTFNASTAPVPPEHRSPAAASSPSPRESGQHESRAGHQRQEVAAAGSVLDVAAQDGEKAAAAAPPVRFAVIGTNWITAAMVTAGRTVPGFELAAVHSRTPDRAAAFAAELGAPRFHTSLDELAADEQVDAVYIASPNALHAEQAIQMLRAGKHVLCEKPIAANSRQANTMFAAARESQRLLMEAYVAPFEPNFEAVVSGLQALGIPRRAVFIKDQYSSRYDRLKNGELPNAFNPLMAAGSLADIGYYTVAAALYLFGPPNRIHATGILLPTGADGQGTIMLGYEGLEVVCMHSKITSSPAWSHVQGEAGTISMDDCSVPTVVQMRDRNNRVHDRSRPQSEHHMRYEIAHFISCVNSGTMESPLHTPVRTLAVMSVLDEVRRQIGVRFPADDQ